MFIIIIFYLTICIYLSVNDRNQSPSLTKSPVRIDQSYRQSPQRTMEPDTRFSPSPSSNSPTTRAPPTRNPNPAPVNARPIDQQDNLRLRDSTTNNQYQSAQSAAPTPQTDYQPVRESPSVAEYAEPTAYQSVPQQADYPPEPISYLPPTATDEPQQESQLYASAGDDQQYQQHEYDQQQYVQQDYDQNYATAEYPTDQQYDPQSGYDQQQYDDQQYQQPQYDAAPTNDEYSVQPDYQPEPQATDEQQLIDPSQEPQSGYAQPSSGNGAMGPEYSGSTGGASVNAPQPLGGGGSPVGSKLLPK